MCDVVFSPCPEHCTNRLSYSSSWFIKGQNDGAAPLQRGETFQAQITHGQVHVKVHWVRSTRIDWQTQARVGTQRQLQQLCPREECKQNNQLTKLHQILSCNLNMSLCIIKWLILRPTIFFAIFIPPSPVDMPKIDFASSSLDDTALQWGNYFCKRNGHLIIWVNFTSAHEFSCTNQLKMREKKDQCKGKARQTGIRGVFL